MSISISYDNLSLTFHVPIQVINHFQRWNTEQDRLVFVEQRRSGSYHGRFTITEDIKLLQSYAEKEGLILPYYGASSASAAIYTLFWTCNGWAIQIEHTATEATETWFPSNTCAPFPEKNDLHAFKIQGNSFSSLLKAKASQPWEAFLQQYRFQFAGTTLGAVFWMIDTKTWQKTNLTDYSDW